MNHYTWFYSDTVHYVNPGVLKNMLSAILVIK